MKISLQRLFLFTRCDVAIYANTIATFALTLLAVLILYSLGDYAELITGQFHPTIFAWVLFLGGLWLTSKSFVDMHTKDRNCTFLTLPVSNLERFLGRLLLTTVGYIIAVCIIFTVASILAAGLAFLIFRISTVLFNPFASDILGYLLGYICLQSLFFLGAIYFRKNNASKTILAFCLMVVVFTSVAFLLFILIVGPRVFFGSNYIWEFVVSIKYIVAIFVPLCAYLIAYLRLCEYEI